MVHPDDFDKALSGRRAPKTVLPVTENTSTEAVLLRQLPAQISHEGTQISVLPRGRSHKRRAAWLPLILIIAGALVWFISSPHKPGTSAAPVPAKIATAQSEHTPSTPLPPSDFRQYFNRRFGYTVSYPSSLRPQGESANGDGQEFLADDGSLRLAVWGSDNTQPQTLDDMLQLTLASSGLNVTYKRRGRDFYVISGFSGANIFYERLTLRANVFWGFRLLYDPTKRQEYDSLPQAISKSFLIPH